MMAIVYKGRIFSVDVETIHSPDGKAHIVETVRHRPSVVLLPMVDDDHVVLVRQYRHSVGRYLWELPAGGVNEHESAESAAARECEEETRLAPERVERIQGLFPAPGFCDEELVYFRLSDLHAPAPDSPHKPDDDEYIEVKAVSVAEAKAMVEGGEILDLKTAYGLTLI
jgi:ADP-ribose pyrophosphatase